MGEVLENSLTDSVVFRNNTYTYQLSTGETVAPGTLFALVKRMPDGTTKLIPEHKLIVFGARSSLSSFCLSGEASRLGEGGCPCCTPWWICPGRDGLVLES